MSSVPGMQNIDRVVDHNFPALRTALHGIVAVTAWPQNPASKSRPSNQFRAKFRAEHQPVHWPVLREDTRECLRAFQCRSEEHTSELQSRPHLVCRLLLEKKK